MGEKLSRSQRKLLTRLGRKHSFESPFLTNDRDIKADLLELEELGHVECQWSRDWAKPVLFAWIPCMSCQKGVLLGETINEVVPFGHCDECDRYASDLAAAQVIQGTTEVIHLDDTFDTEHLFGFRSTRREGVENYLANHWDAKVRKRRAA